MPLNTQTPEKRVKLAGPLSVHSIFKTIQGEGPFCGRPAIFVRLAGCNLQCPLCDTEYTEGRKDMNEFEILTAVKKAAGEDNVSLVVVTGGEPFRQNLYRLFTVLCNHGWTVQVETNGSLEPPITDDLSAWQYGQSIEEDKGVYVVCSPKAGKVHPRIHEVCYCYKYVGSFGNLNPLDGLPMHPLEHPSLNGVARPPWIKERVERGSYLGMQRMRKPIYLQPTDHKNTAMNARSLRAVVESCIKFGYILQLQVHKLIGVE